MNRLSARPHSTTCANPSPKMSFRSRHPQGANFCLADGSVRFIGQGIDHALYRAFGTKNGRESASVEGL